jgi:hypothetical protein
MLSEVPCRWKRVGGVTEELDHFRSSGQRINLDRAMHAALIRLFAYEEECLTVAANVRFASRCYPELWQLEVRRPMIGVHRGTTPSVAISVDVTTSACNRGEADIRSVSCAIRPSPCFSLCRLLLFPLYAVVESVISQALLTLSWLLLFTFDAVVESICGETLGAILRLLLFPFYTVTESIISQTLFALSRLLLFAFDAVVESVFREALGALLWLLLFALDAVVESVGGLSLLAFIHLFILTLDPLAKTVFCKAFLPLCRGFARSLDQFA